jgi:serine/threonine protein kinase
VSRLNLGVLAGYSGWIARQIASGLTFLHGRNIAHMDMNAKKVLLDSTKVKISEFGSATLLDMDNPDLIQVSLAGSASYVLCIICKCCAQSAECTPSPVQIWHCWFSASAFMDSL